MCVRARRQGGVREPELSLFCTLVERPTWRLRLSAWSGNRFCRCANRLFWVPAARRAHEAAVADHIRGQNRCQAAVHAHSPSARRLTTKNREIYADEKALECPSLATFGRPDHVAITSEMPPTTDIPVPMSGYWWIMSGLPLGSDVPGKVAERLGLTRR